MSIEYYGETETIDPENEEVTFISSLPGNNEGGLYIAKYKHCYFWSISYCGEMDWQQIPMELYEQIKLQEENK